MADNDYIDKIKISRSLFDRSNSEVLVSIETPVGIRNIGNSHSLHGTSADYFNYINELADINNQAADSVQNISFREDESLKQAREAIDKYLAEQPYAVDERKLNAALKKYSDNCCKADVAFRGASFWGGPMLRLSQTYGNPAEYDAKAMRIYRNYVADLADAKLIGKDLNTVKEPDERLSLWDKLLGKIYTVAVEDAKLEMSRLSDEPVKKVKKILEAGFPEESICSRHESEYLQKEKDILGHYSFNDENRIRTDILRLLTMYAVRDSLQNKYYEQTGDISVFMSEKEKKTFEKMSFSEMVAAYGSNLLTTHKGVAMIGIKIADTQRKKLNKVLAKLALLMDNQKKEKYCPNVANEVRYHLFEEVKKSYKKFGIAEHKFRRVFEKMLPSRLEQKNLQKWIKASEGTLRYDRLLQHQVQLKKFIAALNRLIDGEEKVKKVNRLKKKWNVLKTAKSVEEKACVTEFSINKDSSKKGNIGVEKAVEQENKEAA